MEMSNRYHDSIHAAGNSKLFIRDILGERLLIKSRQNSNSINAVRRSISMNISQYFNRFTINELQRRNYRCQSSEQFFFQKFSNQISTFVNYNYKYHCL